MEWSHLSSDIDHIKGFFDLQLYQDKLLPDRPGRKLFVLGYNLGPQVDAVR